MGRYEDARQETRAVMERVAAARDTITYSKLVAEIHALRIEPDSKLLAGLLDEVSTATDDSHGVMLSAVVVHATDDYLPGRGFFALGKELGRDVSDDVAFHAAELGRVHEAFAPPRP